MPHLPSRTTSAVIVPCTSSAFTTLVAVAVALCCAAPGTAAGAEAQLSFYLLDSPGSSVQYLSVHDDRPDAHDYFEAVRRSSAAPGGEVAVQTFAKIGGSAVWFGSYSATRSAGGYTLTTVGKDGTLTQMRFLRSNVKAINAAIVALSQSARAETRATALPAAGPRQIPADAADQLAKAQQTYVVAKAQVDAAQKTYDRTIAVARQARADATAAVEASGVSNAQNVKRVQAMAAADDAEQTAIAARRNLDAATTGFEVTKSEISELRQKVAGLGARARPPTAETPSATGIGP